MRVGEVFFTDKQLCARWQCSHMKLWRLRRSGKLPKPIKIGGGGLNLTPASLVARLEEGPDDRSA
jgi:predicted DNA-binding transcriptional regulator AlpA